MGRVVGEAQPARRRARRCAASRSPSRSSPDRTSPCRPCRRSRCSARRGVACARGGQYGELSSRVRPMRPAKSPGAVSAMCSPPVIARLLSGEPCAKVRADRCPSSTLDGAGRTRAYLQISSCGRHHQSAAYHLPHLNQPTLFSNCPTPDAMRSHAARLPFPANIRAQRGSISWRVPECPEPPHRLEGGAAPPVGLADRHRLQARAPLHARRPIACGRAPPVNDLPSIAALVAL